MNARKSGADWSSYIRQTVAAPPTPEISQLLKDDADFMDDVMRPTPPALELCPVVSVSQNESVTVSLCTHVPTKPPVSETPLTAPVA